jgi:HAD superfamily hydrolase (TIGR01509 family)
MTKPIWLFLDFDNTLMGTEAIGVPVLLKRFNDLYEAKIGRPLTYEEFQEHFQGQVRETLCENLSKYFNLHVDYDMLFANREPSMMSYLKENGAPMAPNLIETFRDLAEKNVKFAFASNNTIQRCMAAMRFATNGHGEELARLFGTNYFEAGSVHKPNPDIYLRAINQTGADIDRSFTVEDSPTGTRSALAAGLKTFGFTGYAEHPETREKELLNLGATACFSDWKDFPDLLKAQIAF